MPLLMCHRGDSSSQRASASVFTVSFMWTVWEIQKREQFGERWHTVQSVLAALEELDIHMIEVSPSNIAFRD